MNDSVVRFVPEHRRDGYKSSVPMLQSPKDRRNYRHAEAVLLRRRRRDVKMAKTRDIRVTSNDDSDEDNENDGSDGYDIEFRAQERRLLETSSAQLQQALYSDDDDSKILSAVKAVRQILTCPGDGREIDTSIIQQVLNLGILPRLIELLQSGNSKIQYESAWAVTNIASGTSDQTKALVEAGGIDALVNVLKKSSSEREFVLANQAIWALGNIAGESTKYRDWILQYHDSSIVPQIQVLIAHLVPDQNVTWAMTNLCRGEGLEAHWPIIQQFIPSLSSLLRVDQDNSAASDAAWCLYGIATAAAAAAAATNAPHAPHPPPLPPSKSSSSGITQQLINIAPNLITLLNSRSVSLRIPVFRTLGALCSTPQFIQDLVRNQGLISRAESVILDSNCSSLHQDAFWVLSNIAANGNASQVTDMLQRTVHLVVRALSSASSSTPTKVDALLVVRNALFNDDMTPQRAQLYIIDKGVIPPLTRQLEPRNDNVLLKLCLESLAQVLKNGAAKTTDGINVLAVYIEQLGAVERISTVVDGDGGHVNAQVYQLARSLIDMYFSDQNRF